MNSQRTRLPAALLDRLALPVIAAPMFLVSGPALVEAACRAGIIGALPAANARSSEILDRWLTDLTAALARAREPQVGPWAVNLVAHRSNARLQDDLALCVRHRAPIVITALGGPQAIVEAVHGYGGLVFADVNTPEYAAKAARFGVDGLVLVCAGAGGHTGMIAAPAFVASVREFFDGMLVVAGAMSTGAAVRSAQILGADLVHMGTRFIATDESLAVPDYKQMIVDSASRDIVCTNAITGAWANKLRPSLARAGLDPDRLEVRRGGFDLTRGEDGGKAWKDLWSAGQGVGQIKAIEPVRTVVGRLRDEYAAALAAELTDPWMQRHRLGTC
ncbi:MAG: nitronate monooxygenase [Burkholderiales bacterium]|nr:nitronate monooxygenase [Burkholderiales bacterium]